MRALVLAGIDVPRVEDRSWNGVESSGVGCVQADTCAATAHDSRGRAHVEAVGHRVHVGRGVTGVAATTVHGGKMHVFDAGACDDGVTGE